jgi:tripartite-type tricarboxylate transporter receptor subunit TctC
LPDVPSVSEAGVPTYEAVNWWGIVAPAGTPQPIIERMYGEMRKALALPDVRKTLTETQGMDIVALGPEATQKFILGEMQRWGKVVKENGIKAD